MIEIIFKTVHSYFCLENSCTHLPSPPPPPPPKKKKKKRKKEREKEIIIWHDIGNSSIGYLISDKPWHLLVIKLSAPYRPFP